MQRILSGAALANGEPGSQARAKMLLAKSGILSPCFDSSKQTPLDHVCQCVRYCWSDFSLNLLCVSVWHRWSVGGI